jgi:hypothetical protein
MAFITPSVNVIAVVETTPAGNISPAATRIAALAVELSREGGTHALNVEPVKAADTAADNLAASSFLA